MPLVAVLGTKLVPDIPVSVEDTPQALMLDSYHSTLAVLCPEYIIETVSEEAAWPTL